MVPFVRGTTIVAQPIVHLPSMKFARVSKSILSQTKTGPRQSRGMDSPPCEGGVGEVRTPHGPPS